MAEVQQKVRGLELQLKRYKRHANLKNDLQDYEIKLAFVNRFNLFSEIIPMKEKVKEYNYLRNEKKSESSEQQDRINILREQYSLEDEQLNKFQKDLSSSVSERDSIRNNILVSNEKNRLVINRRF